MLREGRRGKGIEFCKTDKEIYRRMHKKYKEDGHQYFGMIEEEGCQNIHV